MRRASRRHVTQNEVGTVEDLLVSRHTHRKANISGIPSVPCIQMQAERVAGRSDEDDEDWKVQKVAMTRSNSCVNRVWTRGRLKKPVSSRLSLNTRGF